jgi:hypothetical protein
MKSKEDAIECELKSSPTKAAARTSKRLVIGGRRKEGDKEWKDGRVSEDKQRAVAHGVVMKWEGRQSRTKRSLSWRLPEVPWHAHHPSLRGREGERCGQNGSNVGCTQWQWGWGWMMDDVWEGRKEAEQVSKK